MFYTYILEDAKGEFYTGYTADLQERLREHNSGRNTSTRGGSWRCIYYEACIEKEDARRREKYLKHSEGRRMLKRRLKEYLYKRRASRNFTSGYEKQKRS